jgi:uncharacterized SAM-binding protein YcdF (DUF218 family)
MAGRRWWQVPLWLHWATAAPIYIVAFLVLRPDRNPEAYEAGEIARHLLAGEGFSMHRFAGFVQPSANQEPVYPLILALFLGWVPGAWVALSAFQAALWISASRLVGRVAQETAGVSAGIVGLLAAAWPPMVVYALRYHPLWLRSSVLVVVLAAAVAYWKNPSMRRASWLGLAFGLACLARAPFWALPLVVLPWALIRAQAVVPPRTPVYPLIRPPAWSRRVTHGLLAVVLMLVVASPWIIRNRVVLDAWVPGTTTAGYAARAGTYVGASGCLSGKAVREAFAGEPDELWQASEPVRDRVLLRKSVAFWLEPPIDAALLYAKRWTFLWTWHPEVGRNYPGSWTWTYLVIWILCLPLIVIGSVRAMRGHGAALMPLSVWIYLSFVYALFAVNLRFRFESEALLLGYVVVAVQHLVAAVRARPLVMARRAGIALATALSLGAGAYALRNAPARWLAPSQAIDHVDVLLVFSGDVGGHRVRHAARLLGQGKADYLIVTGSGVAGDSGAWLADVAVAHGVPSDRVLVEDESTTTWQNLQFAAPVIQERGFKSVGLVTSQCHQRRVRILAGRVLKGVELYNVPARGPNCQVEGWYEDPVSRRYVAGEYFKIAVAIAGRR